MAQRKLNKDEREKLALAKKDLKEAQASKKALLETIQALEALDSKKHYRAINILKWTINKRRNIQIDIAQKRINEIQTGNQSTSIQLYKHETGGL